MNFLRFFKIWLKGKMLGRNRFFIVHPTFLLVLFFFILTDSVSIFIQYICALLMHELCHFYVAKKCGYRMEKIVLYPFGVSLCGETDEFSFSDEIKISLAGPFFNLFICVLCVASWWLFPLSYYYLSVFCFVNLICCVFNILPVFPLDGGRVLLAVFSLFLHRKKAVLCVKLITLLFSIFLFIIFIFSLFVKINISFGLISILLISSVFSEDKQTRFLRVLNMKFKEKKIRRGVVEKTIVLHKTSLIKQVFKFVNSSQIFQFKIVDDSCRVLRILSESEILEYISMYGVTIAFEEVLGCVD